MGREKDLENAKKAIAEFEERLSTELKRQEKLDTVEKLQKGRVTK